MLCGVRDKIKISAEKLIFGSIHHWDIRDSWAIQWLFLMVPPIVPWSYF